MTVCTKLSEKGENFQIITYNSNCLKKIAANKIWIKNQRVKAIKNYLHLNDCNTLNS